GVVLSREESEMAPVAGEQLVTANPGEGDFVPAADGLRQHPGWDGGVIGVRLIERADDRLEDVAQLGSDVDQGERGAVPRRGRARQVRLVRRLGLRTGIAGDKRVWRLTRDRHAGEDGRGAEAAAQ